MSWSNIFIIIKMNTVVPLVFSASAEVMFFSEEPRILVEVL